LLNRTKYFLGATWNLGERRHEKTRRTAIIWRIIARGGGGGIPGILRSARDPAALEQAARRELSNIILMRWIVVRDRPLAFAIEWVDQCVASSGLP